MADCKQVKVDNWGIYFLQRLKNFFNRTDYCDLTLQFQDNAQLKVHRLVLSACTEYFELLERTCEMYEDCLVMPEDLQADVVVPIINFMYTGQLEFKIELLEKLYQTSLIMNLPILTKLLDAHRPAKKPPPAKPAFSSSGYYGKRYVKPGKTTPVPVASSSNKRTFSSAFEHVDVNTIAPVNSVKKQTGNTTKEMFSKAECIVKNGNSSSSYQFPVFSDKNKNNSVSLREPRPTRYELPEELDDEHVFDNSFTSISYGSKPLMIHPETATKQYRPKRINLFEESSSSSGFISGGTNDIVECRKISANENIFLDADPLGDIMQDENTFQSPSHIENKDNSHVFDQILENRPSKITIQTKNNVQTQNLDHAKIISEVLKKYPHLVKSNKNIKLKILNTSKSNSATKKSQSSTEEKVKSKCDTPDFTYESDVINSKEAAKLIAMGVENVVGPWICLICGTPGKALHFTSYYNFRKHLVDVHNEKPVPSICEYCGVRSQKRNYIVHHKLTKHGVPAPPAYSFPKCNHCDYVALNEALLVKHKTNHITDRAFKYTVPTAQLASVAQKIGKKYPKQLPDKLNKLQCVYCMRVFLREHNLYAHLKIAHKESARNDGLVDDSDEEQEEEKFGSSLKIETETSDNLIKLEVPVSFHNSYEDVNDQYQIEQKPDGSICVSAKKPRVLLPVNKTKILNLGFSSPQNMTSVVQQQKTDSTQSTSPKGNEYLQNTYHPLSRTGSHHDTVIIDNDEYILQDNQLIPKKERIGTEYIVAHASDDAVLQSTSTTSLECQNIHSNADRKILIKKSTHVNQPYQIVVSSEEEYKALLNSNQSVLYDDGQPNKGLSELGEPNSSSLGAGQIDLDGTQSNEMMILPEYHLNVPQTVSADNSNIVVVYSHPVEDSNKQYSIITTQGHFVESSAVLTQNYQTVTTCTPGVNTHAEAENSWQNNIHASVNKLTPATELQTMTVAESITISPMEDLQDNRIQLNELAEVQLSTAEPVTMEVAEPETCINSFDESNIITTINQASRNALICQPNAVITLTDANVLTNIQGQIQSLPSTNNNQITVTSFESNTANTSEDQSMPEISSNSQVLQQAVVEAMLQQNGDESSNKIVTVNMMDGNLTCNSNVGDSNSLVTSTPIQSENTNSLVTSTPVQSENTIDEQTINNPAVVTGVVEEQLQETVIESEETIENIARDIKESERKHKQCDITNEEVPLPEVVKEHIENLTSEWSEEESEITLADQSSLSNADANVQNNDDVESAETEESVENIQKEVNRPLSEIIPAEDVPPVSDSSDNSQTDTNNSKNVVAKSHENISSLLNDWDDNDSQEENTSANNVTDNNLETSNSEALDETIGTDDNNAEKDTSVTVNESELNKNDNIKSLVSDWDEDDEEENGESSENVVA